MTTRTLNAAATRREPVTKPASPQPRHLQRIGVLCGLTAGAWLGAAEAPVKLVSIGVSPLVVSLAMVMGVFLARWSLPALILGTSSIRTDLRRAPHLLVWAILAGCLWAVANTLTVFAVRDVGLSIAFPIWNSNGLLGILWGVLLFNELRGAGRRRWMGVLGGALVICAGAALLAVASASHGPVERSWRGLWAALGAGVLWGTMYIPYRKAYLTGMNPLTFVALFTIGELGMMSALAITYLGPGPLWHELVARREILFWLMAGGFVWVVGDLFQQYAAKYSGISRGIPLSNTNQFWGLLWGALVFGELRGLGVITRVEIVAGSLLMLAGAGAIALSSANSQERRRWKDAVHRECERYGLPEAEVDAHVEGRLAPGEAPPRRRALDWVLVLVATGVFGALAAMARTPAIDLHLGSAFLLGAFAILMLVVCGVAIWRTTRFE